MQKRFKPRKKKNLKIIKFIFILIIIYFSFNLIYKLIYKSYISKLNNLEIIEHIINNTKNNKSNNSFLSKYQNPDFILKNNFNLVKQEDIVVDNLVPDENKENEISKDVLVYIYSTHETESYSDKYLEVYNIKPTVKTISYILSDYLKDYGINSLVETGSVSDILRKNSWSYKYSYEASKELIKDKINNNPTFKLIIDLHRDSSPLNATLLEYNNLKYAKILFVVGLEHDNYEANLNVANKLNDLLTNEVPGISRGISKKSGTGVNGIYNQDLSEKSVLIEIGGQYNEIEELNNSLKVLAKVILKFIEE